MNGTDGDRPPLAALTFGLAGLLPLAAIIVAESLTRRSPDAGPWPMMIAAPGLGYAALILSFLGGMWWSAACNRLGGAALWRWLGLAVAPSLWAAASFFTGSGRGIATVLAAGLVLALAIDAAAVRAGLVPAWWMRLRVPLSIGLAIETLAVAWLA